MNKRQTIAILLAGVAMAFGTGVAAAWLQDSSSSRPAEASDDPPFDPRAVAEGIRKTPGCLGVEAAMTMSGKQVLFAWFEDKKAVLRWYNSEAHLQLSDSFAAEAEYKPLEHIPDGTGPILTIASITPAAKSAFAETSLPVSQIAIEHYAPLPGGLYLGGRFAPSGVKVEHMHGVDRPAGSSEQAGAGG